MKPLILVNRWPWSEEHRRDVEPLVGHQISWEDFQCTATMAYRPHA
jgi:hypothetical protein